DFHVTGVQTCALPILRTIDFPVETEVFDESSALSADEVETVVRNTGAILTDGDVQVAALHYVDPQRFGETLATQTLGASYGIRRSEERRVGKEWRWRW